MKHAWDAGGNLAQRDTRLAGSQSWETENFSYDSLDRLASVSGAYTDNWTYSQNGNINTHNGTSYSYGDPAHKHAVTSNGTASYSYDGNGNMLTRGSANIIWDAENRPISVTTGNITTTIVYDGDGNRVKKTEGGQTTLYVNKYYEKLVPYSDTGNLTAGNVTTHYYLGDKQVAIRTDNTTSYVLQDHLSGTSLITDSNGNSTGTVSYAPFGNVRLGSGTIPTDKKFTGQRLDSTGLYYYGARYYDPETGRFISPDTVTPSLANPQALNRYSYAMNNPLGFVDPTGHWSWREQLSGSWQVIQGYGDAVANTGKGIAQMVVNPVQTVQSIRYAATHAGEAFEAMKDSFAEKSSSIRGMGEITGEVLIAIATIGLGPASTGGKVAEAAGTVEEVMPVAKQLAFDFMKEPAFSGKASGLVIGRGDDLAAYSYEIGEYRLGWMSVTDTLGMQAEAEVNLGRLGDVMEWGLPVRDISVGDVGGWYLNSERGMLYQSGWNLVEDWWIPPL